MACEYICDGCGVREEAHTTMDGYRKPSLWFQRYDLENNRILTVCSRGCIEKAAEKYGGHTVVLPI